MKSSTPQINPQAVQQSVQSSGAKAAVMPKAAFGDVLGGISPFGGAASELTWQATGGSDLAMAVLNASFSGIDVAKGFSQPAYSSGAYSAYGSMPGMMGSPRYTTQPGFTNAKYGQDPYSTAIPGYDTAGNTTQDIASYKREIMDSMASTNFELMELQALMQSNMQQWTTRSNILSADHRARMSIIEKFTARG